MATDELHVSFEGPEVGENGVSLDDLQKTFSQLQKAFSLMVSHLEEATTPSGQSPAWVRRGSTLRLMRTSPGSLVTELGVPTLLDDRASLRDSSQIAIDSIMKWQPEDGNSLPASVADELLRIGTDLSPEVVVVRLRDPNNGRHVDIPREKPVKRASLSVTEAALLYGWLREVDWDKRTAQLHRYEDKPVQLRFDAILDEDMYRLARQHVEVRGHGRFNRNDQWDNVEIEQINSTRSSYEPFDIEAFWSNPNPKIFDPDKVVRASEPFDVDEFARMVRKDRDLDIGRRELSE